ncbi:MAG: leucine--tRNA ligase [Coxiellaceae bacterium]|nr:leucine--tRNA ligase [Coxiellaceae bacterium]|tara:strand:- start:2177 stop:4636 length:2460 start_codon:yes stop_codon:yes gene_type:complete
MSHDYNPAEVEKKAQEFWESHNCFAVKEDLSREKFYCLAMLPYPSGDLHVGHVRNYTLSDAVSRYQHMQGKNVLQPMGWDAFGLPAENAAIKHKASPSEWTYKNINRMRKQLKQLGFAIDWSREVTTCDPSYYQWEQWLFIRLYKKGLIYKKKSLVNWDPVDQTVLANEQVIDGKGWRSGAPVEQREIAQWFFKITDYADELLDDLDQLKHWPQQVITMQKNWIGRSRGLKIQFKVIQKHQHILDVFTTRPDTFMGVTYLAIAPQHPLSTQAAKDDPNIEAFIRQHQELVTEAERSTQNKVGIFSGMYTRHPLTKAKLPIWICNFVLMEYGSGAVMSVPAHDQRDFEFAKHYQLPIQPVVIPNHSTDWDFNLKPYTEPGIMINSGDFNGLKSKAAIKAISKHLIELDLATQTTNYRLRDWGISRQRYWGTPIPMIQCKHCGDVPAPEESLPVLLPTDIIPPEQGSALQQCPEFLNTTCPNCGEPAKRDSDTMDTFVESSWYYARYCSYDQNQAMLDDRANYWSPVDYYIGGIEHAVMHLLYARFMHKVLRDEGLVNSSEPFKTLLTQGMVLKDGAKMSKSKGNTVSPTALIKQYGADTLRFFQLFAAPPEQSLEWSDSGIEGSHRFLKKLWMFCMDNQPLILSAKNTPLNEQISAQLIQDSSYQNFHTILEQACVDMERSQFNTVASATMKMLNLLTQMDSNTAIYPAFVRECVSMLLRVLAPITPHLTHHLWILLEYPEDIFSASWPTPNQNALEQKKILLIVQINGKKRATLTIAPDLSQSETEQIALENEHIQAHLSNQVIKKVIVVPKKLINIVV